MASKTDLLKRGANKTGKGLFAGMTPIIEEESENTTPESKKEAEVNSKDEISSDGRQAIDSSVVEENGEKVNEQNEILEEKKEETSPKEMIEEILKKGSDKVTKEKKVVNEKPEKASRYEKEKFLLLDIRGYRDYVEHMAKAANMSATKYIRSLIEEDMNKNMDIYEAHKALEEKLKERK